MAPEVFDGHSSYPSDMWAAGCIMYILLSGEMPFLADTNEEIK